MNLNLQNKKVYIFDWDGTIFNSMPTKIKNFGKVFNSRYGISSRIAEKCYIKYSGNARLYIFNKLNRMFSLQLSLPELYETSDVLTNMNKKYLLKCNVFYDAINLISYLIKYKNVCISSSVPQKELDFFFKNKFPLNIKKNIKYVLGSKEKFSKGKDHINFLRKKFYCDFEEMIMIGDDEADINLANLSKIDAIYINRNNKKNIHDFNMVKSLDEVLNCLQ